MFSPLPVTVYALAASSYFADPGCRTAPTSLLPSKTPTRVLAGAVATASNTHAPKVIVIRVIASPGSSHARHKETRCSVRSTAWAGPSLHGGLQEGVARSVWPGQSLRCPGEGVAP